MRYFFLNSLSTDELFVDLVSSEKLSDSMFRLTFQLNSTSIDCFIKKLAERYFASFDGIRWKRIVKTDLNLKISSNGSLYDVIRGHKPSHSVVNVDDSLVTKMPGKIMRLYKKVGESVKKGETLLILEAMKMENEIKSPKSGTIKSIFVEEGQSIPTGHLMIEIDN